LVIRISLNNAAGPVELLDTAMLSSPQLIELSRIRQLAAFRSMPSVLGDASGVLMVIRRTVTLRQALPLLARKEMWVLGGFCSVISCTRMFVQPAGANMALGRTRVLSASYAAHQAAPWPSRVPVPLISMS
jgi:hypothetical protein